MILLIDNYDSFTYNLYQYMGIFNDDIKVVRNDKITIEEIKALAPERIVLSPGRKARKKPVSVSMRSENFMIKYRSLASVSDTRASGKHLERP